jgi:D-alanyl-lipoteichoic acid acyltransferase DltB (MBOAT superfamily)
MCFVPAYILILLFTIIVGYFVGISMESKQGKRRKHILWVGLFSNIGVLAFFKYFNFLNNNLSFLLHGIGVQNPIPYLSIILPIGLSFHTFQEMSYLIEVYRGRFKAERHFGIFSVYVMFYPQLVAGPIERPQHLLPQFREKHYFDFKNLESGIKLMLWGLFKKIVIADRLALYVNSIYNNVEHHNGPTIIVATIFFSFQIYCDFSGYSDIAVGAARVMGFKLINNFNVPYLSKSIAEFWSKWHISLSNWLRDYVYLPVVSGLNKKIKGKKILTIDRTILIYSGATFVTFAVSGIWHGAAWTFVLLGVLHAIYLIFAIVTKETRFKMAKRIKLDKIPWLYDSTQILITFILVTFAYIFFRANSFEDVVTIIKKISTPEGKIYYEGFEDIAYSLFGIVLLIFIELKSKYFPGQITFLYNRNWLIRSLAYAGTVIVILLIGVFDGGQFIYFQF